MTDSEHKRLIDCYDRGSMTESEVLLRIIPVIADSKDAWHSLSKEWQERIMDAVRNAPCVNEDWDSMRIFHVGTWSSKGAFDSSELMNRRLLLEYRRGVETFRNTLIPKNLD